MAIMFTKGSFNNSGISPLFGKSPQKSFYFFSIFQTIIVEYVHKFS